VNTHERSDVKVEFNASCAIQLNGKSCHVKGTGGDESEMKHCQVFQDINFVSSLFLKQIKQNANVKYSCQNDKITVYYMIRD
jgi:hypothetical protein